MHIGGGCFYTIPPRASLQQASHLVTHTERGRGGWLHIRAKKAGSPNYPFPFLFREKTPPTQKGRRVAGCGGGVDECAVLVSPSLPRKRQTDRKEEKGGLIGLDAERV